MAFIELTPVLINAPEQPLKLFLDPSNCWFFEMPDGSCKVAVLGDEKAYLIRESYRDVKEILLSQNT
jgi:hypothetical protein